MARRWRPPAPPQGPQPSVAEPRAFLLEAARDFVLAASACPGVVQIALVGSLATPKPVPKDADLLVTLAGAGDLDLAALATVGRRLKGRAQTINLGADIFLCDSVGRYLGRICGYRECHVRALCRAHSCGLRPHLNDDLDNMTLPADLIASPPFVLWPQVERRRPVPGDVERLLLAPLTGQSSS